MVFGLLPRTNPPDLPAASREVRHPPRRIPALATVPTAPRRCAAAKKAAFPDTGSTRRAEPCDRLGDVAFLGLLG